MPRRNNHRKAVIDDKALQQLGVDIPGMITRCHELVRILRSFGVVAAYECLEHQEIVPEACLKRASRYLDLMAHHGDKWLFEPWFKTELDRLRARHGTVRFLLSNTIETRTVTQCRELMANYSDTFEARLFAGSTVFRAVIIDHTHLLLGHYGYEVIEKDWSNAKGWKSPQLFIEDNKEWSLLIPICALFGAAWEKAAIIERSTPPRIDSAVKRDFHLKKE